MATNGQAPFSLRPWPTGDKNPQNLADFISRVNAQPGGFRNLSEAELRKDIQSQQYGRIENGGSPISEEEDEGENDEAEETTGKSAVLAREDFLKNVESVYTYICTCQVDYTNINLIR